jgi:hypothetical protein
VTGPARAYFQFGFPHPRTVFVTGGDRALVKSWFVLASRELAFRTRSGIPTTPAGGGDRRSWTAR